MVDNQTKNFKLQNFKLQNLVIIRLAEIGIKVEGNLSSYIMYIWFSSTNSHTFICNSCLGTNSHVLGTQILTYFYNDLDEINNKKLIQLLISFDFSHDRNTNSHTFKNFYL